MEANFKMDVRKIPVDQIKLSTYNPRKELNPGDYEYEAIRLSIKNHGFVDPLVWNEFNGVLIGGHQRLKVLTKEFGQTEVWCSVVNVPSLTREKALNISLNRVSSEFDFTKLKDSLFSLDPEDQDLIKSLGFEQMEFEQIKEWEDQTSNQGVVESPEDKLAAYQKGLIKQIVMYFDLEAYKEISEKLKTLRELNGCESNTELLILLVNKEAAKLEPTPAA